MSTSSYSHPKRSIPITYLLIFQADTTHDFSGAVPQSLEDYPVNIHFLLIILLYNCTCGGMPHFVVLTGIWFASWSSKATTAHAEHNYFVVSLYSLIRLHSLPIFKVQPHVKRPGTFFWSVISDPWLRLVNLRVECELALIIVSEIPIILLLSWGMRDLVPCLRSWRKTMAELGLDSGFVSPCPNCSTTFLSSILVLIYKGLWFQQAQLGSSEYLFIKELGLMRKKMDKFPFFFTLISLLQGKCVTSYSFLLSGFYSEWSVKGTRIPESTLFIYSFLKN